MAWIVVLIAAILCCEVYNNVDGSTFEDGVHKIYYSKNFQSAGIRKISKSVFPSATQKSVVKTGAAIKTFEDDVQVRTFTLDKRKFRNKGNRIKRDTTNEKDFEEKMILHETVSPLKLTGDHNLQDYSFVITNNGRTIKTKPDIIYRPTNTAINRRPSLTFKDGRSNEFVVDTSVSSSISAIRNGNNNNNNNNNRTFVGRSGIKTRTFPSSFIKVSEEVNHQNHKVLFEEENELPIVQIINGSDAESLRRKLEMSTEFFLIPNKSTTTSASSLSTMASIITRSSIAPSSESPDDLLITFRQPLFRNEVWVVPILALSSICMLLIVGFEVFVLCKAWRTTPSRRHLFLGQMLLLGLFCCAALGSVLALAPSPVTCAVIRFGTGVAYAVVFASLLVKCVFLISLNGGVYLPAPYQGLLLLFAALIQVAIGGQWLLTNPPSVDLITVEDYSVPSNPRHKLLVTADDVTSSHHLHQITLCRTSYVDILYSLCYVLFLIVFVAILAIKSRGIRDNYREATYIGLSVGCTIPIWLVWTLSGLVVGERHRDACLAFGLVITAAVIFLVMFMPKGRQLAAMGKDGVFLEDREDRFSSLSRAGSGYSPSFFHFKPVKYGTKHHAPPATITTLGADRVALCPAPPSYSRMFHCYPNQYYYPARYLAGGVFLRPDDGNVYTTLEPTLSSNPNVYFQRGNGMHPGMMY